ncbi:hypothetical protein EV363DRAFT_1172239 [Boletus edulis]|nr:hypothetical protein EV363DRAFT_1172239 [Boletus edulis]
MPRRLHPKGFLLLHSLLLLHASIRHTLHLPPRFVRTSPRHIRLLSLPPVLLWRIRRISPPNLSKLPLALHVLDQAVIARAYRWTSLGWGRSSEQTGINPPQMVCCWYASGRGEESTDDANINALLSPVYPLVRPIRRRITRGTF